jgi:tRNA A-37 threonylcarbamoyl transferase component Bud32
MDLSALGDGYQLVRPIGRGTTTMVLEAWDRPRRRRVALKVPVEPFAGDEAFLDRLQREVWAVAGFTHANVAAVHAIERDGQAAFVVVELVDGSSLRDMLADRGPLPPVGAARVAARACAAVAAAHAHGIVHGHLVPANVLLTIDGRVKVTDFRLAQATLASGGVADPGDDVRALGRCLAAMLTGRELAGTETARPGPTAPAELATIVARAAGDRHDTQAYRSAAELGRDLARFLAAARPGAGGTAQRDMAPAHAAPPVTASRAADRVPVPAASVPDRPATSSGPPSGARRRRRLTLLAGLVTAGLGAGGVLAAGGLLDREPSRLTAGNAVAPPPSAILAATTSRPASSPAASTTAPSSTRPPTTTAATPSTTSGRGAGPGQRVVPNVVGLHREQAADVLAQAQLGVHILEVPVPESGKAQRVIAQQPSAGQVVPARSDVLMLVGTRRPTG